MWLSKNVIVYYIIWGKNYNIQYKIEFTHNIQHYIYIKNALYNIIQTIEIMFVDSNDENI